MLTPQQAEAKKKLDLLKKAQTLTDYADLVNRHDVQASKVFEALDQAHVALCGMMVVAVEISSEPKETAQILNDLTSLKVPNLASLHGTIEGARKVFISQNAWEGNGKDKLEAVGLTVHDWDAEWAAPSTVER